MRLKRFSGSIMCVKTVRQNSKSLIATMTLHDTLVLLTEGAWIKRTLLSLFITAKYTAMTQLSRVELKACRRFWQPPYSPCMTPEYSSNQFELMPVPWRPLSVKVISGFDKKHAINKSKREENVEEEQKERDKRRPWTGKRSKNWKTTNILKETNWLEINI